jgi:hypothetical protein
MSRDPSVQSPLAHVTFPAVGHRRRHAASLVRSALSDGHWTEALPCLRAARRTGPPISASRWTKGTLLVAAYHDPTGDAHPAIRAVRDLPALRTWRLTRT